MAEEVKLIITGKDEVSGTLKTAGRSVDTFKKSLSDLALETAVTGAAVGKLAKTWIDSAVKYEQTKVAFETMLGSASKAKNTLKELYTFAAKTPFTIADIEENSKKLLAYGIAADDLIPTLTSLGNIAAGVGTDKFPQLTLAYGQVMAATKLTGAELRQFTEAGVPLLDVLAQQSGKTAAQVKKDMESGMAPSFEEVKKAMESLSSEGGRFYDLMGKQSLTLGGKISNLQDSWELFGRSMGETVTPQLVPIIDGLKGMIQGFSDMDPGLRNIIGQTITWGSALAIGAGGLALIISHLNPLTVAIFAIAAAWSTWNAYVDQGYTLINQEITGLQDMAAEQQTVIDMVNGKERERWQLKQTLMLQTAELEKAIMDESKARDANDQIQKMAWISEEKKQEAQAAYEITAVKLQKSQEAVNGTITDLRILSAEEEVQKGKILLSAQALTDAKIALGTEETKKRVALLQEYQFKNKEFQEYVMKVQGDVTKDMLSGMETAFKNSMNTQYTAAQGLRAKLEALFKNPIIQTIQAVTSAVTGGSSSYRPGSNIAAGKTSGKKQGGGFVQGGNPYMVGEAGTEMFVPGTSGSIIPNHKLGGGGVVVNINVQGDLISDRNKAVEFGDLIVRYLEKNTQFIAA